MTRSDRARQGIENEEVKSQLKYSAQNGKNIFRLIVKTCHGMSLQESFGSGYIRLWMENGEWKMENGKLRFVNGEVKFYTGVQQKRIK